MFEGFIAERRLVNGLHINYRRAGSGPPVLLLHGFPQTLAMWAKVAPLMGANFTVVCVDLRGYGDSDKPACAADCSNYSFRAMAEDQLALMRSLGFERYHVVGHDRGGRTGHRMALDHPEALMSLAVLDIVPTIDMFTKVDRRVAATYWHWYFLQQPAPFPETMIEGNPDLFYETCLAGWGATGLGAFDPEMLAEYRRCWRQREAIYGSCADYRAAARVDIELDLADRDRKVTCPALALWGSAGTMHKLFDFRAVWSERCSDLRCQSILGGHFFVDQFPAQTARILIDFVSRS